MWTVLATFLELSIGGLSLVQAPDLPLEPMGWTHLLLARPGEENSILIIDETRAIAPPAAPDLGELTDLGPGSLNLEAMAALDATIDTLIALEAQAPSIILPAPFACDLVAESNALTQSLLDASDTITLAWNEALIQEGVSTMAQETEAQQCAYTRAMQEALARVTAEAAQACSPVTLALKLTDTVRRVSANAQPKWARELSLLAQKQAEHTLSGKNPADLCPDYRALEAAMQMDIRG